MRLGDIATTVLSGVVLAACATTGPGRRAVDSSAPATSPDFLEAGAPRAELLLLGVFHFADPGLDAYKPRFQIDIHSPERQREVEELVERLALFRPTRIAVEAERSFQPQLDSLYSAYNAGLYRLGANEVDQIGFRLARYLGLARVHAVDAEARSYMSQDEVGARIAALGLDMDTLMRRIEADPWTSRYRRLYAHDDSLKTVRTLTEHLLYVNDPERIRLGHGAYLVGSFRFGAETDYLGPDDATSWYNRNLRIFSHLQDLTSGPEERILLIIGAGHLPILRFLAQSSPEYRLREPAEFLTPPAR